MPKDTKQLLSNYDSIPNDIIRAIVSANRTRKDFIASRILEKKPAKVGLFRLNMKHGSDNFRNSSMLGILKRLVENGTEVMVYEPLVTDSLINGATILNDLDRFKAECDLIITNRYSPKLDDVAQKVYTRDSFGKD